MHSKEEDSLDVEEDLGWRDEGALPEVLIGRFNHR